jgi:hypothetical protein
LQPTAALQGIIFKSKILPDIFNYWTEGGTLSFSTSEVNRCVKVSAGNDGHSSLILFNEALGRWIRNNWHPWVTVKASKSETRFTRTDAMWRTQKEAVEVELKLMLGVDELDTSTPGYFEQRTAAIKRIYERMDEVEKEKVADEVKRLKAEGNSQEIRQK